MTLSVLRLVGSLLKPLGHLNLSAVILNPVCCLGGCLLAADNLPDNDHHADFRALHSKPFLGSVQDLADLDRHKVLFLLCFAFSPRTAATGRTHRVVHKPS